MLRIAIMADFSESYSYQILRGIANYGGKDWYISRIPLEFVHRNGLSALVEYLKIRNIPVIIGRFESTDNLELFADNGILPIALDYKARHLQTANVTGGYIETGQMAADYFIDRGFKNFAFYGNRGVVWSDEREQGFNDRILSSEVSDKVYSFGHHNIDEMWSTEPTELCQWLESLPKPVALFACDDLAASMIVDACNLSGILIPTEVSVLGVDNDEGVFSISSSPISSISLNTEAAGRELAEMIDLYLHGDESVLRDVLVLPTMVHTRRSSDQFAYDNPYITKVLKYIDTHIDTKMSVDDIVDQVPLSRRLLEMRFKESVGSSIMQYIQHRRMTVMAEMILTTNDPIPSLAAKVGINDCSNLSRLFKKYYGCAPSEYRDLNR